MKKRSIENERHPMIIQRPKMKVGFWKSLIHRILGKWLICILVVSSANAAQTIVDSGPPHTIIALSGGTLSVTSTSTVITASVLPSGAATEATSISISTTIKSIIGSDYQVAPSSGLMIGGIDDDGNFAPLQVDRHHGYRQLHVASIDFAADRAAEGHLFGTSRTTALSTPGGAYNILLVVNLSTSPVNVYPYKFIFDVDVATAQVNYKIYADPVVTSSGSFLASTSLFLGDVATSTASYAQTYTNSSLSSVGTLIEAYASNGSQSLVVNAGFAVVIAPGHKIVVRAVSDTATQSTLTFKWAEAP